MFARFLAVGGLATAIQYCILILLTQLAGLDPVVASAIGFCVSALANYALNRRFTFRSSRAHAEALPRFAVVALTGLTMNSLLMAALVHGIGANYIVAQVLTTGCVLVWNFILNKHWSFQSGASQ